MNGISRIALFSGAVNCSAGGSTGCGTVTRSQSTELARPSDDEWLIEQLKDLDKNFRAQTTAASPERFGPRGRPADAGTYGGVKGPT